MLYTSQDGCYGSAVYEAHSPLQGLRMIRNMAPYIEVWWSRYGHWVSGLAKRFGFASIALQGRSRGCDS